MAASIMLLRGVLLNKFCILSLQSVSRTSIQNYNTCFIINNLVVFSLFNINAPLSFASSSLFAATSLSVYNQSMFIAFKIAIAFCWLFYAELNMPVLSSA
jgi:hypothetical protein